MPSTETPEWKEPTAAEIVRAAGAIESGRWRTVMPPEILDIRTVRSDTPPDDAELQALFDFWCAACARNPDHRLTVEAVDPVAFPKILSNVMLLDVESEGHDARYRVYGSGISEIAGKNWTGHRVSDMNRAAQTSLALFYRSGYLAVYRTGKALYTHHDSPRWLSARSWKRLVLPVYDKAGKIARFLVGNVPVDAVTPTHEEWSAVHRKLGP